MKNKNDKVAGKKYDMIIPTETVCLEGCPTAPPFRNLQSKMSPTLRYCLKCSQQSRPKSTNCFWPSSRS